jgi:hypothetical protein
MTFLAIHHFMGMTVPYPELQPEFMLPVAADLKRERLRNNADI